MLKTSSQMSIKSKNIDSIMRHKVRNLRAKVRSLLPVDICFKQQKRNKRVKKFSQSKQFLRKNISTSLPFSFSQQKQIDFFYQKKNQVQQSRKTNYIDHKSVDSFENVQKNSLEQKKGKELSFKNYPKPMFEKLTKDQIEQIQENKYYFLGDQIHIKAFNEFLMKVRRYEYSPKQNKKKTKIPKISAFNLKDSISQSKHFQLSLLKENQTKNHINSYSQIRAINSNIFKPFKQKQGTPSTNLRSNSTTRLYNRSRVQSSINKNNPHNENLVTEFKIMPNSKFRATVNQSYIHKNGFLTSEQHLQQRKRQQKQRKKIKRRKQLLEQIQRNRVIEVKMRIKQKNHKITQNWTIMRSHNLATLRQKARQQEAKQMRAKIRRLKKEQYGQIVDLNQKVRKMLIEKKS